MELALCVVGGWMAAVLLFGLFGGFGAGSSRTIHTAPALRWQRVVRLDRNTFKVVT